MASGTEKPLKGILKDAAAAATAAFAAPRSGAGIQRTPEEAREIALHHARIIQNQKDIEAQITDCIVELTEYPLVRDDDGAPSAARPAASDVAGFKELIRLFQPHDYDDMIAERNTCGLCGYALCANPRKTFKGRGEWKLVNAGRADFNIVERKELEKWCSRDCARRALYIKVQLNETAAWERAGIQDIQIDLLEEESKQDDRTESERLAVKMSKLKLEEERKASQDAAALALERGDDSTKNMLRDISTKSVDVVIREKQVTSRPDAPSLDDASSKAKQVEGHLTTFGDQDEATA